MGEIQRFIPMTAFPLTLIHLAMMITFEFPDYATDIKFNKQTMLTRMGWQNGMNFQNFLVISRITRFLITSICTVSTLVILAYSSGDQT
jgi:1,4-dihydroxy-2-naphthoate octaprenyltransferase